MAFKVILMFNCATPQNPDKDMNRRELWNQPMRIIIVIISFHL